MQFEPPTFAAYDLPVPPGGVAPPSPYDPVDAIYAAARMLCGNGTGRGEVSTAIFDYNHSTAYVQQVLAQARAYATVLAPATGSCASVRPPDAGAFAAIVFACQQLGQPYVWGGNGSGNGGFDCSGLTTAAYAAAGIALPPHGRRAISSRCTTHRRTAVVAGGLGVLRHGHAHPPCRALPGWRHDDRRTGLRASSTVEPFRWPHDDFFGATRPSN